MSREPSHPGAPPWLASIDVALIPELIVPAPANPKTVYVVVDVIRATTTLGVFFERGCRRVLVAPDIATARAAHARLAHAQSSATRPLLAGEVGGVAPPGFDFGNSPAEIGAQELRGREVIFATTNGTRALQSCVGGGEIFAGSLRNSRAVAAAALAAHQRLATWPGVASMTPMASYVPGARAPDVAPAEAASEASLGDAEDTYAPAIVVVCAGRDRRPAYDDTLCAGYLASEIAHQADDLEIPMIHTEGTRIALGVMEDRRERQSLREQLAISDAAAATRRVGLAGDLDWCAALDSSTVVPRVTGTEGDLLIVEASDPRV
jgi:2-phosphosulfolactate phosphatase